MHSGLENDRRRSTPKTDLNEYKAEGGPFVVATEKTRMPLIFTRLDDDKHTIIYANNSFLLLTGYRRSEVIDQGLALILAGPDAEETYHRIVAKDAPAKGNLQALCKRRDGTVFLAAVFSSPVNDDHRNAAQTFISFVDLDEHFRIVKGEQMRANLLYENAPGFIAITEGAGHRFTFANDAFRELIGGREVGGKSVAEAVPEVESQGLIKILDQVFRSGQPYSGRCVRLQLARLPNAGLETRYVDFIHQAMRNEANEIIGLFCEGHDVTDLKAMSDELRVTQSELVYLSRISAMGTMAATLAHELNQPLAVISNYVAGCTQLLESEGPDTEQLAIGLLGIGGATLRAGHIIRRLREMTMRTKSLKEPFDLADAQHEAVALVRVAGCDGVEIVEQHGEPAHVFADRIQIQQVIVNLVKNACEAAALSSCRQVTVSTEGTEDGAIMTVSDTGSGVSPGVAKTLFSWSDSTKSDGTGIGLAICRTIIDSEGGKIWLDRDYTEGARFCFSLPVAGDRS